MAATETAIANIGLMALGSRPITDIDSTDDENAIMIASVFDHVRDVLLSVYEWQFATVVEQLTEDLVVDNYTIYEHAYDQPSGLIRIVNIADSHDFFDRPYTPYLHRGNHIYTDESECWIRYVSRVTDVTQFPVWFDEALGLALAERIATRMTENLNKAAAIKQDAAGAVAMAMRFDALAEKHRKTPSRRIDQIG